MRDAVHKEFEKRIQWEEICCMRLNKKIVLGIMIVLSCSAVVGCGSRKVEKSLAKVQSVTPKSAKIDMDGDVFNIEIVYCDEQKMIWKDYFGLFVYSFETKSILASLDVKDIHCDMCQGDHACQFRTYDQGRVVELYTPEENYYYLWEDSELYTEFDLSTCTEDKNENLVYGLEGSDSPLVNRDDAACADNYVKTADGILYFVYADVDGKIGDLMYVKEDEQGNVTDRQMIFLSE